MKLKILSWNIWCGTYLDKVTEFLKTADADIIALQEVSEDERGNIAEQIAKELGYECVHAIGMHIPSTFLPRYKNDEEGKGIRFGNAILTKHRIQNSNKIDLSGTGIRWAAKADIAIGNKELRVYGLHLPHTHQKPDHNQNLQAENLVRLAAGERTLIMGDFNALPESTPILRMRAAFQDSEAHSVTPTWSVYEEGCTMCRIGEIKHKLDYVFTSKDLKVCSHEVYQSKASDHLPIGAVIEI